MSEQQNKNLKSAVSVGMSFWQGARYPFKGLKFVYFQHPALARIWIFPIFITIAGFAGAIYFSWSYSNDLTNKILGRVKIWMGSIGYNITDFFADSYGVLETIVMILLIISSFLVVFLIIPIIAAPFNDLLSEKVEYIQTKNESSSFSLSAFLVSTVQSIGFEALKLTTYLAVMGIFFIGSFILPLIGQGLYSIAGFLFTAAYFALDYSDWPASRRQWSPKKRFRFLFKRFPIMIGFGCGVWVLLFIPIINLFFMPAAVAGGTLLFLDLEKQTSR